MKRFFLAACICAAINSSAQTLFTYGTYPVSADEFMRAYNKNNATVTDKEKALREYLDLYMNFKLKVKAASDLRYDTLPHIKADMANFRLQVQDNYLADDKAVNALYNEAFNRSRKDLHVLHFSVPVLAQSSAADTMKAFDAIRKLHTSLSDPSIDPQQAADNSSSSVRVKFSDIGFVTVFTLPYNYENVIYSLKPGQYSAPYRSKNAWHVFKVVEERPAAGKWKVAQILISVPSGADDVMRNALMQRADSVYRMIKSGSDFSSLVQKYSDDKFTFMTGGELPEFGTGKYDISFEREVFKLRNDGEVTQPFLTPFGIHIVKRIAHTPVSDNINDPATQFELKDKIKHDSRIEDSRNAFARALMAKIGVKKLAAVKDADIMRYADSAITNVDNIDQMPFGKRPLLQVKKETVKASDWLRYYASYKSNPEVYKNETQKELWDKYLLYATMEHYKKNMEDYNSDFRFQMKEFQEGNMLFEIMEKNVWSKASDDSIGLHNYYNMHKNKYIWETSADVLIFNCGDAATADKAYKALQNNGNWREVASQYASSVQVDSGRYEIAQLFAGSISKVPESESFSSIVKNEDGSASFVKFLKVYPSNQQRTFEEARGLVINDYQGVLEEQWLASLRKKYPLKVNDPVFKSLLK